MHGRHAGGIAAALLLGLLVLIGSSWSRGTEYDEGYSVFIAAGTPRPAWPSGVFTPHQVRHFYTGHSTASSIARDLRHTDVHPPLYFWCEAAWRGVIGTGLFRTRLLSVLFSLMALCGIAALAARIAAPPVAAILLAVGCYGFTYTGSIARGFALAQVLMIWGAVLILLAAQTRPAARATGIALAGGVLLGLASFTNYLAAFGGAGALLWLLLTRFRQWPRWVAAGLGFAAILPADLYFFLAQRGSRVGQFPPFRLLPSLVRLGKYGAANVFGGLPLYVGPMAGRLIGAVLVLLLAGLVVLVALRWRHVATPDGRWLLLLSLLATPIGLLALGFVFNNTPIELRYLAFALPFLVVLLAATFASLAPPAGAGLLAAMLCIQVVSIAGLMIMPQTMQPQAQAAQAARGLAARRLAAGKNTLVLVPYGNDGVGVLGAFVNESPDDLHILAIHPGTPPAAIRSAAASAGRVVLVLLGLDEDSRAVLGVMQSAFEQAPCYTRDGTGFDVIAFDRDPSCHRPG